MESVIYSVIAGAIVSTIVAAIFSLIQRGRKGNVEDVVSNYVDKKIEPINSRVHGIGKAFDEDRSERDERFQDLREEVARIDERQKFSMGEVEKMDGRLKSMQDEIKNIGSHVGGIEGKMAGIDSKVDLLLSKYNKGE